MDPGGRREGGQKGRGPGTPEVRDPLTVPPNATSDRRSEELETIEIGSMTEFLATANGIAGKNRPE